MCVTVSKQPWHLVELLCRSLPLAFGIVAPAEPPGLTPCCTSRRTREIRSGLTRERLIANAASGDYPPEAPIKAPPDTQSWTYPVTARQKHQLRHRRTSNRGREHDVGGVGRHLVCRLALPVPMPSLDRQLASSEASFGSLFLGAPICSPRFARGGLFSCGAGPGDGCADAPSPHCAKRCTLPHTTRFYRVARTVFCA